jgi:hypothetical protein
MQGDYDANCPVTKKKEKDKDKDKEDEQQL